MSERSGRLSGRTWSQTVGALALRVASNPVVAVVVFGLGVAYAVWAMRRQGVDAAWPFIYAHGVWGGHPIFNPTWLDANLPTLTGLRTDFGLFWPAAMGIVMLPLAAFTFETARVILLLVCVAALSAGTWALFGLARPHTRWPVRLTVAGLVLLTACARWCWTPVQLAPLLAGLLVATLVGLHRGRPWMAFAGTALVIALKPTVGLPFVLLLVLHRRFKMLALALAVNVVVNVIAFARLGGFDAVDAYREGTSTLERRGGINTPNFWEHISIPRVDWIYLVTGFTGSFGLGRAVALLAGAAITAFLCLACLRMVQPPSLADSCRIMLAGTCVGLVIVYHHHYDLAMLIPPLLLVAMLHRELGLSWSRWVAWSFLPVTVLILFLPANWAPDAMDSIVGYRGPGLVHVSFPIAMTLALAGSLAMVLDATGRVAAWRMWVSEPRRFRISRSAT